MKIPYIGITDFTAPEEAEYMAAFMEANRTAWTTHVLMVGVMMSWKTLNGKKSSWTDIFPTSSEVKNIFIKHPLLFNTLHYADYDGVTTKADILRAARCGGAYMHAMQLDMIWPDPDLVRSVKKAYPDVDIVLQAGGKALEAIDNDTRRFRDKLRGYGDSIDYVLLDRSMGRGVPMNPDNLIPFLEAMYEGFPHINAAVAGGLGPDTVQLIEPLIKRYPGLSIDAQARLRRSGDARDPINWGMAEKYVARALELFQRSL